jgi:hypothetical protein
MLRPFKLLKEDIIAKKLKWNSTTRQLYGYTSDKEWVDFIFPKNTTLTEIIAGNIIAHGRTERGFLDTTDKYIIHTY